MLARMRQGTLQAAIHDDGVHSCRDIEWPLPAGRMVSSAFSMMKLRVRAMVVRTCLYNMDYLQLYQN